LLHKFPHTSTFSFIIHHKLCKSEDIKLHSTLQPGLCYTSPLLLLISEATLAPPPLADIADFQVNALLAAIDTALSSPIQEFAYISFSLASNASCGINALAIPVTTIFMLLTSISTVSQNSSLLIPSLTLVQPVLLPQVEKVISWFQRKATVPWQDILISFAFTGQHSKDKTCAASYPGINSKTCHILLADHATT
jgi:hypothetical protein